MPDDLSNLVGSNSPSTLTPDVSVGILGGQTVSSASGAAIGVAGGSVGLGGVVDTMVSAAKDLSDQATSAINVNGAGKINWEKVALFAGLALTVILLWREIRKGK